MATRRCGQTIRLYGPVLKVYGRSFSVWPHDLAKEYSERVFSGCPYGDTTHPLYMYNTTKTLIRGEGEGHYRAAPGRQKTRHSHARVTHEQPTQAVESSGGCPRAGYIAQGALMLGVEHHMPKWVRVAARYRPAGDMAGGICSASSTTT